MDKINERLAIGKTRYGHGVRVDDDTTTWGTKKNSWLEMAEEELLDCLIYISADYIRHRRQEGEEFIFKVDGDDNEYIKYVLTTYLTSMEPCFHKTMIMTLFNMLERCSHFY